MESTIIVPSSSSSSVDSNIGPIVLSSDDDSSGDTNSNRLAAARKRKSLEPIYTGWGFGDERTILMELAAARRESGEVPSPAKLFRILRAKGVVLNRQDANRQVISRKVNTLKTKFVETIDKGDPGNKSRDRKIFALSKEVWPELFKARKLI